MSANICGNKERGYIAFVTLMILMLLIGTGIAYLKWSADESVEFKRQYAATVAYYIAQSAISQDVIPRLFEIEGVPPVSMYFEGEAEDIGVNMPEGMEGTYFGLGTLSPEMSSQSSYGGMFTGVTQFYNVPITGRVIYTAFNRFGGEREIVVDTTLYIKYHSSESWAQYLYFTNFELTIFGEPIKFFNGDTLWWDIYSNDQIAIMQSPVFYGQVFTTAPNFWQGPGYNPQFYGGDPTFNCDTIPFYTTVEDLRIAASSQGHFWSIEGYQYRCTFLGDQGLKISYWPLGLPFMDSVLFLGTPPTDGAFFCDGRLEVTGTDPIAQIDMGVQGRLSLGSSGDIWLLDNVRYVDSDPVLGIIDSSTQNMLGLMSESNVLIQNSWENGRDNGGNTSPTNPWRSSIILNAGIVALNQSFSFEDQNDIISAYNGSLPEWYYSEGPSPDERGQIHLWGQVSQYRRGYVHRSNHGGTGYLKDYHYDYRFYFNPPPYYPRIEGNYGINKAIVAWGAGPVPQDIYQPEEGN